MNFVSNQQAKSQGTIMFKVIPITERPVHNQTMVIYHHLHLPHSWTSCFPLLQTKYRLNKRTFLVLALRAGHGGLQPSPGPDHPLCRRRYELQKRGRPGDRGPDRRPLVAGQETAQQHILRRPHPLHQPAETVRMSLMTLYIEDVMSCFFLYYRDFYIYIFYWYSLQPSSAVKRNFSHSLLFCE